MDATLTRRRTQLPQTDVLHRHLTAACDALLAYRRDRHHAAGAAIIGATAIRDAVVHHLGPAAAESQAVACLDRHLGLHQPQTHLRPLLVAATIALHGIDGTRLDAAGSTLLRSAMQLLPRLLVAEPERLQLCELRLETLANSLHADPLSSRQLLALRDALSLLRQLRDDATLMRVALEEPTSPVKGREREDLLVLSILTESPWHTAPRCVRPIRERLRRFLIMLERQMHENALLEGVVNAELREQLEALAYQDHEEELAARSLRLRLFLLCQLRDCAQRLHPPVHDLGEYFFLVD